MDQTPNWLMERFISNYHLTSLDQNHCHCFRSGLFIYQLRIDSIVQNLLKMCLSALSHKSLWQGFISVVCTEELQKRNEVIRVLTKRVWVVETREEEVQKELSVARQQLCELQQKQLHISQKCEDFEVKLQHQYTFIFHSHVTRIRQRNRTRTALCSLIILY